MRTVATITDKGDAVISREARILDALGANGSVQVAELARDLDVSEVTIRKDLDALERRQLLRRTRGGALLPERGDEGAFRDRLQRESAAKRAIAAQAATLVADGDVIALDTSSTAHYLALELLQRQGLVVITQSLPTATVLMERSDARVIMPGGTLRRESSGLVGPITDALVGRGRVHKAFVGVVGLSPERGLLELATDEAVSKQALVAATDEVHGLFDSSKIDGFALHPFARAEQVTSLITDADASDDFVEEWRAIGVPVARVPLPDAQTTGTAPVSARAETASRRLTLKEHR
ncbi:DeoR/GlpR family DNA-binding transcription regulator [Agrococcus sp. Marseille-Q4369]|uniref:DeoR/GlpR family DNA-binding transcription regulator n=1 Tax=Agrococcus sp. Marseille-Q4369 TaxID=2810513 RepID=UPI001B8B0C3E|nr:DeoR/GlpR family DNA-binding transcription regulator [Agrococcus sp. Marseille-Q4369]QUW17903.1 DeoR/GlpR transcriptional regulator [Agrococcus sp. Marseille-Q4369]